MNDLIKKWTSTLLVLSFLTSCTQIVSTDPAPGQEEETFQQLLEEAMRDSYDQAAGISMAVVAPSLGIDWSGAVGSDRRDSLRTLGTDQPFRIASVTKTFVAAAILRLHEMGRLELDESIAPYISEAHQQLLRSGGYQVDDITFRHCLNHTSGFLDYAMSNPYMQMAQNNPRRRWTRTDQLQLAMEIGPPLGQPGERYSYNDTGYILAGEAIEGLVDSSLAYGLRSLLSFDQLALTSTWLETLEDEPEGLPRQVRRYLRRRDFTDWDPSIDLYGGGGLVSTTRDLAHFAQALFEGKIYQQETTLDKMLSKASYGESYHPEEDERYKDYRLGLWEIDIYGEKAYTHFGLWGTQLLHIPAYNCSIAINFTSGHWERLMKKTILVIRNRQNAS
ncbi:MAG: serine hydrolase domain-containing protein [Bacteroidota bacterium]